MIETLRIFADDKMCLVCYTNYTLAQIPFRCWRSFDDISTSSHLADAICDGDRGITSFHLSAQYVWSEWATWETEAKQLGSCTLPLSIYLSHSNSRRIWRLSQSFVKLSLVSFNGSSPLITNPLGEQSYRLLLTTGSLAAQPPWLSWFISCNQNHQ